VLIRITFFLLLISSLGFCDEYDLITKKASNLIKPMSKEEKRDYIPVIWPMTATEKRKYIPLIPRIVGKKEALILNKKKREDAKNYAKKVREHFVQEKNIHSVKRVNTKIRIDNSSGDFFNSLLDDNAAIDME